jgi:prepilin-type N-terminal cleavage/methylation domain-containing protein
MHRKIMSNIQKGFTLVELLIYIGMISILFTVLAQIFGAILDDQLESEATSSVQQDGRFILSRFSYDIQRADDIVIPADLGDQSSSLQLTITGVNYIYDLNNGNLELTNDIGTNTINSSDSTISGLSFTRIGNSVANAKNTVQIQYTVTSKIIRPKGLETKDYQTTIGIR